MKQALRYLNPLGFNMVEEFSRNPVEPEIKILEYAYPKAMIQRIPAFGVWDAYHSGLCTRMTDPASIPKDDIYCINISDVRILGFRTIIDSSNHFFTDILLPNREKQTTCLKSWASLDAPWLKEDTDIYEMTDNIFSYKRYGTIEKFIQEPVIVLGSAEPSNYGSWLFRILPKLGLAQHLNLTKDYKVFVYRNSAWMLALLDLFGIPEERVIFHNPAYVYHLRQAFIPSLLNSQAYIHAFTRRFYQQHLQRLGIVQERKRLVYLARLSAGRRMEKNSRQFLDEQELCDRLAPLGFEIIELEKLPQRQQMEIMASVKMMVCPSGSAMFNVVYAPEGATVVDIEAFPFWLHAHANLFASNGLRYGFLVGRPDETDDSPSHKRWNLNVDHAVRVISDVLQTV
jgi:hypothetical protein